MADRARSADPQRQHAMGASPAIEEPIGDEQDLDKNGERVRHLCVFLIEEFVVIRCQWHCVN